MIFCKIVDFALYYTAASPTVKYSTVHCTAPSRFKNAARWLTPSKVGLGTEKLGGVNVPTWEIESICESTVY